MQVEMSRRITCLTTCSKLALIKLAFVEYFIGLVGDPSLLLRMTVLVCCVILSVRILFYLQCDMIGKQLCLAGRKSVSLTHSVNGRSDSATFFVKMHKTKMLFQMSLPCCFLQKSSMFVQFLLSLTNVIDKNNRACKSLIYDDEYGDPER